VDDPVHAAAWGRRPAWEDNMNTIHLRNILALATGLATSMGSVAARADGSVCQKVFAAGETIATGPASFAGTAHTNLGDLGAGDLGDRQVTVAVLGLKPNAEGFVATTSHTFVGPDGWFTTTDRARLVELSPGLYLLDTQASITEGGWGQLTIDGLVDFRTGYARWFAHGEVCRSE
jgi:hypothetical protein